MIKPHQHPITICFTDTETGGLVPRSTCIIQIGVVKVEHSLKDPLDMRVLYEWERKLKIPEEHPVSERAAAVNGYRKEIWDEEARDRRLSMMEYCKMLEWSSFGGQNAQFDYRHIEEELFRQGLDWPRMKNYTLYSVEMLARPMYLMGYLPGVKQEEMASYFNLGKQTHDALDDVRQSVQIYRKLLFLCIHGLSEKTLQQAREMEPFDMTPQERAPADV